MTSRDFCYWLQGYIEIATADSNVPAAVTLTAAQISMIQKHLALVFKHEIDPSMGDKVHQQALDAIHDPNPLVRC